MFMMLSNYPHHHKAQPIINKKENIQCDVLLHMLILEWVVLSSHGKRNKKYYAIGFKELQCKQ